MGTAWVLVVMETGGVCPSTALGSGGFIVGKTTSGNRRTIWGKWETVVEGRPLAGYDTFGQPLTHMTFDNIWSNSQKLKKSMSWLLLSKPLISTTTVLDLHLRRNHFFEASKITTGLEKKNFISHSLTASVIAIGWIGELIVLGEPICRPSCSWDMG